MEQLELIDRPTRGWKLDRKTIETGRQGVAHARAVLRQAAEHGRRAGGEGRAA